MEFSKFIILRIAKIWLTYGQHVVREAIKTDPMLKQAPQTVNTEEHISECSMFKKLMVLIAVENLVKNPCHLTYNQAPHRSPKGSDEGAT